jgi:hypothetical protein
MDVGEGSTAIRFEGIEPRMRDARGKTRPTSFTASDISNCSGLFSRLKAHRWKISTGESSVVSSVVSSERLGRIERMMSFLTLARAATDLGVKIVNYCICLEVLFSTSSFRVAYQVAERVARFIETDADQRIKTFDAVKKAYGIRSIVVHGDTLKEGAVPALPDTAEKLDFILRRVFGRILSEDALIEQFELPKGSLEDYFRKLH